MELQGFRTDRDASLAVAGVKPDFRSIRSMMFHHLGISKMKLGRYQQHAIACSLLGAALICAPAFAQDEDQPATGLYVAGAVGAGRPAAIGDDKSGILPTLSAGYAFANGLRPELEISYRYNSKSGGAEHAASAIGNVWWDVWQDGYYFYAGGGFGATHLSASSNGVNGSDTLPAWQAGLGFGHSITGNLALGVDYRHLATVDKPRYNFQGQSFDGPHYMSNAVLLELRYSFGGSWSSPASTSEAPVRVVPVSPN